MESSLELHALYREAFDKENYDYLRMHPVPWFVPYTYTYPNGTIDSYTIYLFKKSTTSFIRN